MSEKLDRARKMFDEAIEAGRLDEARKLAPVLAQESGIRKLRLEGVAPELDTPPDAAEDAADEARAADIQRLETLMELLIQSGAPQAHVREIADLLPDEGGEDIAALRMLPPGEPED